MKSNVIAAAAMVAGLLVSAQTLAHHSFSAEFDADKKLNMHGVVTKVDWTNPHTYFYMEVAGKKAWKPGPLKWAAPTA